MTVELVLIEAVVILAASVVVVLVSHRLRAPAVVGLLLTGIVVGPSGLGLVRDVARVEIFAEIGVVFLLFSVGLEFSLRRLREVGRPFLLGGGLQTGLTVAAAAGLAWLLGVTGPRALLAGFLLALSSTAIVLKLYNDRRETESPQGKIGIAILLFQDFMIVPMIVMVPVLAGRAAASPGAIALRFGAALAGVALVFLLARVLMPRLLEYVVRTRVRELFVLGGLLMCLGLAVATAELGFSLALGAFIAGLIVSESEYSAQVVADIVPFRDLFTSVFFVSIGMLIDVPAALDRLHLVAALALGIVVLKALVTGGAVLALGYPARTAVLVALALAQIGEFSFVLMDVGRANGLLDAATFQLFLGASVLTMLLTPALLAVAPGLAARLPLRGTPAPVAGERERALRNHVVVVGFGLAGRTLVRVLRSAHVPYTIVELNGVAVREARAAGEPIIFGDATRREVLEAARIEHAGAVVFVVSDIDAVRRSLRLARALNGKAFLLVRTRQFAQIEELLAAGADEVIAEEFETAIEILTRVLQHYHVPRNVILAETRLLRGQDYRMIRQPGADREMTETLRSVLEAGTTDLFRLPPGTPHAGRTIRELDLRRRSGASIVAVVRGETPHTNAPPEFELAAGDCLVLVGSHQQIEDAFTVLQPPQRPARTPRGEPVDENAPTSPLDRDPH